MLFLHKHGRGAAPDNALGVYPAGDVMPLSQACGFLQERAMAAKAQDLGKLVYFFPDADPVPDEEGRSAALDRLARTMIPPRERTQTRRSGIPHVYTFFGQFIDHDILAVADVEPGISVIDGGGLSPLDRRDTIDGLRNLRSGRLRLDALYGGGTCQGPFAGRMAETLRFPWDRAKLWAGTVQDTGSGRLPLPRDPADRARDLLRLGRIVEGDGAPFEEEEFHALPQPLRGLFVDDDGKLIRQRAIIGDLRNDDNLPLAQFHLAMLRLHNRVVDAAGRHGGPVRDRDALFHWARREVTLLYQWMILNLYLPMVCDPAVVSAMLWDEAPLYRSILPAEATPNTGTLPVPLEFSAAAFRFGHSMLRGHHDWNRYYGQGAQDETSLALHATLEQLFALTGGSEPPMRMPDGQSTRTLPAHWPVEWARFLRVDAAPPVNTAPPINAHLIPVLAEMVNERENCHPVLRHLAMRNLRRGHRMNIASAQECAAGVMAETGMAIHMLNHAELLHGASGEAILQGGFLKRTPLWFYILKEAELRGRAGRLGPLGSRLVAETLCGLVMQDASSYWHCPGSGAGNRWHPRDGVQPQGRPLDSMAALMEAVDLL